MSNVISENYSLISVMSRFGLPLGFGEKTVAEICKEQGVDCPTFLTVVNFVNEDSYGGEFVFDYDAVSLPALVEYLKQAHSYFLTSAFQRYAQNFALRWNSSPRRTTS